jgi:amino acid permease
MKTSIKVQAEELVPPFDSNERHSPMLVATFNLVATIVGGGVLSLPYAFYKCGVVLATILMIFAAVITDRSLYLLCLCARQTRVKTYGQVGKAAFGPWMETAISGLLFVFLLFVLVAYMVLIRDIWTPVVGLWVADPQGNLVLFGILLLVSPFLVQKTLYELRFNCYVGFCSVSILCLALAHHAILKVTSDESTEILYITSYVGDALFAFPIITLSFLSSFNVLPVQSALVHPTKPRVSGVVDGAVFACFALMYTLGLAGYVYAGSSTEGNILLNCDHSSDVLFLLGRIGCGITIMLATAMVTLPCRESFMEVIDTLLPGTPKEDTETCATELTPSTYIPSDSVVYEQTPLLSHVEGHVSPRFNVMTDPCVHYASTFGIVTLCFVGASAAPSVAIVWSLCGSSMAFVISFLLPAASYLKIHDHGDDCIIWRYFAWFLVLFSIVGSIACTVQTVLRF